MGGQETELVKQFDSNGRFELMRILFFKENIIVLFDGRPFELIDQHDRSRLGALLDKYLIQIMDIRIRIFIVCFFHGSNSHIDLPNNF